MSRTPAIRIYDVAEKDRGEVPHQSVLGNHRSPRRNGTKLQIGYEYTDNSGQ
ncbi:hypothetical protein MTR_2g030430 [Medicago truncatula]|uniref:Uncharacterized protein n=1 Tax=Medicago truncatula TaxID=3880 RepID=G7IKW5_MEDTR|nr:hypothetical protein MTR_2g030430 [Medicago truncatula]